MLISVALTGDAFAFEIETPISHGCHEQITVEARDAAGYPDTTQAPVPTEDQRRTANDLTFSLPDGAGEDLWTMTLLLGVRSNDIGDAPVLDSSALVALHDDPEGQGAHCLRGLDDNGPEGDATALAACRTFIIGELGRGRFFNDTIDVTTTEPVPLYLAYRLDVTVALPQFAYRLGRALHALQDSYSHALRNPETGAVRHVTNWIDFSTNAEYDATRDGQEHLATIDDCRRDTPVQRYHVDYGRTSVTDLLNALRDPSGFGDERLARVQAVLDRAFVIEPGCTRANRYCDAPELDEVAAGCSVRSGAGGLGTVLLVGAALGWGLGRRRAGLVLGILLVASPVAAEPEERTWHADLRFGGALDHPALAFSAGAGVDIRHWTLGLVAEWNPWFSFERGTARAGALNVYGTLTRRWYENERFTLHTRVELGTSTVLFDLVGVDQYTTGLYFGGALLGIAVKKARGLRVTFDPIHFAMPIPKLAGVPFYWLQYRVAIGLEFDLE